MNTDREKIRKEVEKLKELMEAIASGDESAMRQRVREHVAALPDHVLNEAKEKITKKDQLRRFKQLTNLLNDALFEGTPLIQGTTIEEDIEQYMKLISHAKNLWDNAVLLFQNGQFPTALFLSIVCMEEAAKLSVAYFQIAINEARRTSNVPYQDARPVKGRKNPLFSHPKKHFIVALSGALVNTRVDRRLGMSRVVKFLEMAERGELESLRQSCLYVDRIDTGLTTPAEIHGKSETAFYVALAGELLAQSVLDDLPSSLYDELNDFEAKFVQDKIQ